MEHRCGYRRAVNVPVILRTRLGLVGKGVLSDVSASGGHLTTTIPVPIHSVLSVQEAGPRRAGSPKRATLEAEVVRSTPTGFGVEWTEFAPEAARALYKPPLDTDSELLAQAERRPVRR